MAERFKLPQDHLNELLEIEISPTRDLRKQLPTRRAVRECDHEDILRSDLLEPKKYLLQYLSQHPGQLVPMRRIMDILASQRDAVLSVTDLVPTALESNARLMENVAVLNGSRHVDDVKQHVRTVSEILLKTGAVYPYIHELMEEKPADFIELMKMAGGHARANKHHGNYPDRMVARYVTEYLLDADPKNLVVKIKAPSYLIRNEELPSDSAQTHVSRDIDRTRDRSRLPSPLPRG